jgi:hypothetical protein
MRLDGNPRPVPGAGEVLVVVKASGVGPWDRLVHDWRIINVAVISRGCWGVSSLIGRRCGHWTIECQAPATPRASSTSANESKARCISPMLAST